ncbi:MAG UNVERIFIED_CONTAM: helix-turn-helix domain-containing protein [Planctomycetaceae bacterium]
MNELEQVWRERIDWVQASGLTIAEASAELGVSAATVYRWKKLLAESPIANGISLNVAVACSTEDRAIKV